MNDHFGEEIAAGYDDDGPMFGAEVVGSTVEFLAELAGDGAALELGIGTGRVAIPLAERGVPVHGIDLSEAMVARLRGKPGGAQIGATIGDFATTRVDRTFRLAYLVFNTIMNLTTQDAQVACFENVAHHLEPVGVLRRRSHGPRPPQTAAGRALRSLRRERHARRHRRVRRHEPGPDLASLHERGLHSVPFRYVWPAELDLMARIAGLTLLERWADWDRSPFTSESRKHVSVWHRTRG